MRGRATVVAVAATMMLVAVACSSPAYEGQPGEYANPGFINVRPAMTAIHVQYVEDGVVPSNAQCVMGITAAGVGVIGSVALPPAGVAAWVVYGLAGTAGFALGDQLESCLNQYTITRPAWEVITQCPGYDHKTLYDSFTDYGQATAFVAMDFCRCSLACQFGPLFAGAPLDAPGLPFSLLAYTAGRNYYHDGPNRVNGPVSANSPPPSPGPLPPTSTTDGPALAAQLGIPYGGCSDVGAITAAQMATMPGGCP